MRIASIIARFLMGLVFAAAGLSGFWMISHGGPPPTPGLAGEFQKVFFASHWVLFVDAVQLIAGLLLLANRFVPLALMALAAVLANILVFHITMMPSGIVPGLVLTFCWLLVAQRHRAVLRPLLNARPPPS
jgi:putative oxidoreductase